MTRHRCPTLAVILLLIGASTPVSAGFVQDDSRGSFRVDLKGNALWSRARPSRWA
jgi:hypothetical protein